MGALLTYVLSLAPNSETELSFDLDNFKKIRAEAQANTDEIVQKKDEVVAKIDELKDKWKTPAGTVFFQNVDNDWVTAVEKYRNTMKVFIDVMDDVIEILQKVEDQTSTVTF